MSDPGKEGCVGMGELFSAMLDGELAGEDRARLEGHLLLCRQCRQEYEIWRRMAGALRSDPASGEPSPGFCAGVMRRLAVETAPGRRLFRTLRTPAAAAAAAVMMFAGSWGLHVAYNTAAPKTGVAVVQQQPGGGHERTPVVDGEAGKERGAAKTVDGGGGPEAGPVTAGPGPAGDGAPAAPPQGAVLGNGSGGAALVSSRKEILSTILKLSVADAAAASREALAAAGELGGGGQTLAAQKRDSGELLILRLAAPAGTGGRLADRLAGLGVVLGRSEEIRDVTDSYTQAAGRLREIESGAAPGGAGRPEAEASALRRQIQSWDEESSSHIIILWLEQYQRTQ